MDKRIPLHSAAGNVVLYLFVVDILRRIAVEEIIMVVVNIITVDIPLTKHKIVEHLAACDAYTGSSSCEQLRSA